MKNWAKSSIPVEFKDENKWKFGEISLSTLNLGIILAGLFVTYILYKVFLHFHMAIAGIIIGTFLIVTGLVLTLKIPDTEYLKGGGVPLYALLFRLYIRKHRKVIYVKGYGADSGFGKEKK